MLIHFLTTYKIVLGHMEADNASSKVNIMIWKCDLCFHIFFSLTISNYYLIYNANGIPHNGYMPFNARSLLFSTIYKYTYLHLDI